MLKTYTTKVCIVGAGVSGLKTAHTLLHGSKLSSADVIILEAQNRVGGRILTDNSTSKLGLRYDMGAAWFHDALTNSVLYDSIADGSFDVEKDGYFDDKDPAMYSSKSQGKIDSSELKLNRIVEDVERFIEIYYSESSDIPDVSLDDMVEKYISKYGIFLSDTQKNYCGRMLRYMELWYGIPLSKISGKYTVMDHQGRNLYNKKGYGFVIDKLKSQINCPILLGEQVQDIYRDVKNGPKNHKIVTVAGTTIDADYLVVTVPQSVLELPAEHEYGIKWTPALPSALAESFQHMHFGALGKVILEFDHIWWDNTQDRIQVLADGVFVEESEVPQPFQYPIYVVNYGRVQQGAASLVILTQSPVTDYLEANPEKAWEYMKPMLNTIKVSEIAEPINVIVSNWTQNPYIRGSYTSLYVGDDPNDLVIQLSGEHDFCGLGSGSTIRFAGEHTIADGAGCVHGAYNSGTRAGEWILNHVSKV